MRASRLLEELEAASDEGRGDRRDVPLAGVAAEGALARRRRPRAVRRAARRLDRQRRDGALERRGRHPGGAGVERRRLAARARRRRRARRARQRARGARRRHRLDATPSSTPPTGSSPRSGSRTCIVVDTADATLVCAQGPRAGRAAGRRRAEGVGRRGGHAAEGQHPAVGQLDRVCSRAPGSRSSCSRSSRARSRACSVTTTAASTGSSSPGTALVTRGDEAARGARQRERLHPDRRGAPSRELRQGAAAR